MCSAEINSIDLSLNMLLRIIHTSVFFGRLFCQLNRTEEQSHGGFVLFEYAMLH